MIQIQSPNDSDSVAKNEQEAVSKNEQGRYLKNEEAVAKGEQDAQT